MKRIVHLANDIDESQVIYPIHLFLGSCIEATGVCGELYLYLYRQFGENFIQQFLSKGVFIDKEVYRIEDGILASASTINVLDQAKQKMKRYKQTVINEGHVIEAIIEKQDNGICSLLDEKSINAVKQITCAPRDLIVYLDNLNLKSEINDENIIRKAARSDFNNLFHFVENEFGARWLKHIKRAFTDRTDPSIYLYTQNDAILGFACFDLVREKKGLFGPMGTSHNSRSKGIGKKLLFTCIMAMKEIGYEYAIIGEAGPIEFYERTIKATIIPKQI